MCESGGKVTAPETPVRKGYYFDGWYSDVKLTQKWNFNRDIVTESMNLYAKWVQKDIPLGTPVGSPTGEGITEPVDPPKPEDAPEPAKPSSQPKPATKKKQKVPYLEMTKTIKVGKKFSLSFTNVLDSAKVTYKSSDKKIASVDKKGGITAKKAGTATVTATIRQNDISYKVVINVRAIEAKGNVWSLKDSEAVTVSKAKTPLLNVYRAVGIGKKTQISLNDVSEGAKVTFSSEDTSIATVSENGVIKGIGEGFTGITATVKQNGIKYSFRLVLRVGPATEQMKTLLTK